MTEYQTKQNDVLDAICLDRYGHTENTMLVLEKNLHLQDQSALLPAGLVIELPEIQTPKSTTISLWD